MIKKKLKRLKARGVAIIATLMAVVGLSGCAMTPVTQSLTSSPPPGIKMIQELKSVPFFAQTQYHCGPAALAAALNATGVGTTPSVLANSIYTPGRKGTLQSEITTGSRRAGRLALPMESMATAFAHVSEGRPELVLQNLALEIYPQWHYALLVGYNLRDKTVTLRSGTERRKVMSKETFEHTWRRSNFWGVVVMHPDGDIPDQTQMSAWLNEAYGVQRAGRGHEAMTAYRNAAAHWNYSTTPYIMSANLLIADNRIDDAIIDLRKALVRDDKDPRALNNLADALLRRGDLDEAELLARRAVSIGGATQEIAALTLEEILEAKSRQRSSVAQ